MRIIAEDLEIQTDAMERMVVGIASMQEFHLDYFTENKYREIEKRLLKETDLRVIDISQKTGMTPAKYREE